MNKKLLAEAVSKALEFDKKTGVAVVETVFEVISKQLSKGTTVEVAGFGKFEVRKRAARKGFNPRTKEEIKIKASKSVGFKAAKALKEAVK